jgi:ACS family hexuronate transporter-like MFS transporter
LAVLIACTASHFLNHLYTGALSPFLPYIKEDLSLSLTDVGIITSAAVVAMTLAHLLVGYMGDKGWRENFITASILGSAVSMILASYAQSFMVLAILQGALGVGASGYHPSVFPALAERFRQRERAKATGIQAMGGLVGMAVIPFLGVTLYEILGNWRPALALLGIAGLLLVVPIGLLMRYGKIPPRKRVVTIDAAAIGGGMTDPETSSAEEECNGQEGWTRNYWISLILMGLRGMSFRCTSLLMPVYLVVAYAGSVDALTAGYLTTVMLAAGLVGEMVSAPLSDRIGKRVPFLVASSGVATPALLLLNYSLGTIQLILVLIVIGFFFYLGVPANTAYQTEVCPRGKEGLAFGLIFSVGSLPGAVSPIIFGALGDMFPDLSVSILFLVATTTLATIVSLLLKDIGPGSAKETETLCVDTVPFE